MYGKLKELTSRIAQFKEVVKGEQQTKNVLIEPVLLLLGYNITNPFDIATEYTCDFGTKKGEKVDYALMKDNEVILLVEAKDCNNKLDKRNIGQLYRYYGVSDVSIAMLTNGLQYLFFTDTVKQNTMDMEPFFTFNILDFTEEDVEILTMFKKEVINLNLIRAYTMKLKMKLKFREELTNYLITQTQNPTNDFITCITQNVGMSAIPPETRATLIQEEMRLLLGDKTHLATNVHEPMHKQQATNERSNEPRIQENNINSNNTNRNNNNRNNNNNPPQRGNLTGTQLLTNLTQDNVTATRPIGLQIGRENYTVSSWTDVLMNLLGYVVEHGCSRKDVLAFSNTQTGEKGWVGLTPNGFNTPKELRETHIYIETQSDTVTKLRQLKTICARTRLPESEVRLVLA